MEDHEKTDTDQSGQQNNGNEMNAPAESESDDRALNEVHTVDHTQPPADQDDQLEAEDNNQQEVKQPESSDNEPKSETTELQDQMTDPNPNTVPESATTEPLDTEPQIPEPKSEAVEPNQMTEPDGHITEQEDQTAEQHEQGQTESGQQTRQREDSSTGLEPGDQITGSADQLSDAGDQSTEPQDQMLQSEDPNPESKSRAEGPEELPTEPEGPSLDSQGQITQPQGQTTHPETTENKSTGSENDPDNVPDSNEQKTNTEQLTQDQSQTTDLQSHADAGQVTDTQDQHQGEIQGEEEDQSHAIEQDQSQSVEQGQDETSHQDQGQTGQQGQGLTDQPGQGQIDQPGQGQTGQQGQGETGQQGQDPETDGNQSQVQTDEQPEESTAGQGQVFGEQGHDDQIPSGDQGQGQTDQLEQAGQEETSDIAEQKMKKKVPADGMDPATRGDEDDIMSEASHLDDNAPRIPDDHYYDYDDHISRAMVTEESGLPEDLLVLHHSFGYDCYKRANLQVLDTHTAVFAAGNVVQLLDLNSKQQKYLRSTSGGGIGAIAVHPSKKYFAVAEKGSAPHIVIYEFPSLKLYRILRGGTEQAYAYVDFSPDGTLLASVGGDPDYMLTLWDWKQEKVMLRSKAFSQDVFRVTFSAELEGQLTSAGTGHIRFWKKAYTFTGLKLQGQLGKFGKKEISDIEGYVELPDGKVLSGSEAGNLLLWDGGLIKVEISRKNKKPCHTGTISQVIMDEGELMTVGIDGYIRVWDFETIDTADVTDEADLFEMEPMNELKVETDVQLKSIVKSVDPEEPTMWYAQDANGGIWKLDLSFSFTSLAPECVMSYHAGPIVSSDTSPVSHLVATVGNDSTVRVYDYITKTTLCTSKYVKPGSSILWVPATVDPKGSTILAGFEDGVVRLLNFQKREEVPGRKHKEPTQLLLKQAFKPHNGAVTSIAIDSQGSLLATGGADNTVFFLRVGENYEPVGFIQTPSEVTHMEWSPASSSDSTLLVCCKEGQVLEITSPDSADFDTSHSFQISGLPVKSHQFKSVKSRLRHEEELARIAKEQEAQRKREEEERRIRLERGLETESDPGDDDDKKQEKVDEEEWSAYIPADPSPVLHGFYGKDPGKVWLSMGNFDAGYLYEVELLSDDNKSKVAEDKLYEPTHSVPIHDSNDVPIHSIKHSSSGKYMLLGLEDGSVRIQPVHDNDVSLIGPFWSLNVHDNHYGQITHLATSYDDRYLFTVGADGNFFVFEMMEDGKIEEKVAAAKARIPSARKDLALKKIEDIEDPSAYSIEDAKQKSEYDKMMKLAEEKKTGVRLTVTQLREQFRKLLDKNSELPSHLQLRRKEFEMDPEIKRQLEQKTQDKVDLVQKEMAWEAEKHRVALDKLRTRFKDIVECERIVIHAFLSTHEVASYRASKLTNDFYAAKAEMERRRTTIMSRDEASRQATQDLLAAQRQATDPQGQGQSEKSGTDSKIQTTLKGSMGERITKALAKVEEKKRKRALRRAQWEELNSTKPDDDYEDPADLAAIKEAKEHMGDYKLKSANDYVVPDHLRMNAEKARARLIILKELIHKHKYDFNQKLLALRDKKIRIIDEIRELVAQLDMVQSRLNDNDVKPLPAIPRLHPDEIPEKKYEYTRETLLRFKEEMSQKKEQAAKGVASTGGFGGFGAMANDNRKASAAPSSLMGKASHLATDRTFDLELPTDQEESTLSPLQLHLKQAEQIRLLYERDHLFAQIDELLGNFDAELRCLRHNKYKLDIDLKNADLRQVTLFEELLLLKDFEKQENVLAEKVETKQQEKLDMQGKVIEVQQKLENKKKDIEKLLEKEKALNVTFTASLGENNKFADYLTKVFKKKIKRSKKKATEGEGSDSDSDEDSDDDSDWSESEGDSDSEAGGYDLDVCPPGCDQTQYDNTCALREKRLDIEEDLVEEKKNRDGFNKELETLQKKAKIIDAGLNHAEQELEAFQLEKQQKLNELDVVVTMKLHQIQHVVNGVLPLDLSGALVFESAGVVNLQHRIKELEHEKSLQKRQQKDAKKKHVQLIKDRRVFDQRITDMEDQCNRMMLQKFGRIVDLEKLETVTVNRQLEELKEKLRINEAQCAAELNSWDEKIQDSKGGITDLIRENTALLDQLNMLLGEKKQYEKELDSRQKNLGSEYAGARKSDIHERQRLIQLVHLQAQEVEALKEEIMLLSRKGGHILPPAQPPMPHSAQGIRGSSNT